MFSSDTYIQRRRKLKEQVGSGLILFIGNNELPMKFRANAYRFHQDASFLYYWGLDFPGLSAVIDIDDDRELILGNDFTVDDIMWMGPQVSMEEWAGQCGAHEALPSDQLKPILDAADRRAQPVHYLPPYRTDTLLNLEALTGIPRQDINSSASRELIHAVVQQRLVKSEEEVRELETAVSVTKEMFDLAMELTEPDLFEYEVIAWAEGLAMSRNSRPAHNFIFTTRGERLHGHTHNRKMAAGDLVVMDAGVESAMGYTSDVTRSFPVAKRFSDMQKEIYQIVLRANESAIEKMAPGVPFRDIHLHAASVVTDGLQQMGLMKGPLTDSVEQGAHALFFPHGIGHPLGLEIHDLESLGEDFVGYNSEFKRDQQFGLSNLRFARPLETGMVMTVEPGIYFIPDLIQSW
ncbi:MAG: M24 family metallopeptidase, partial [Desulfobacteraceae bacterium]